MNTTYDTNFRFNSLLNGLGDTLHRWKRAKPATIGTVANAIKTWQNDWDVLSNILQKQSGYSTVKSIDVKNAFDDAWEHRDNPKLALDALEEAYGAMKSFSEYRDTNTDNYVPLYRRRAVKAVIGDNPLRETKKDEDIEPAIRVKSLVNGLHEQIEKIHYVPQDNRGYIMNNPHLEGAVYNRTVSRVKSWMNENYPSAFRYIHPDSRDAIKSINDSLDQIERLSNAGLLTDARRRQIQMNIRQAFKSVKEIRPIVRTNAVKASLLQDVDSLRNRLDNTMALVEFRNYGEDDIYRDVTEAIKSCRNIATAAPIKYMPEDTVENFYNLDRSLSQILLHRNTGVRIKALRAAAANLDVIAGDLAEIANKKIDPAMKGNSQRYFLA